MSNRARAGATAAMALALISVCGDHVRADAIDGEWCREGRHFIIDGPKIVTYGGTQMTGDYDRHGFRYTVPATEPEAGLGILMVLHSETTLELFRLKPGEGRSGSGEIWNRCRVTS